ncbi:MAG: BMP family ABC transporter substrate-binding protein [Bacteroides sp.]|nr:BMP family ABC transporter substrate-binding protein [Eubacterium sp.]MCM1417418.1 BMP family ABC transporter substrate-binding protein [Roseburia sp.]MCM1461597.1 BMP family ABC transporter substrate-binding protein [Bacteroides sp.]
MKKLKRTAALFLCACLTLSAGGCAPEEEPVETDENDPALTAVTDENGTPVTDEAGNMIADVPEEKTVYKVGFLYNLGVEEGSTAKIFESARKQLEKSLAVETCYIDNVLVSEIPAAVYELQEYGCNIIVSCSPRFSNSIDKEAKAASDTYFINFGGSSSARNLSAFGGELYQTANVCGIAAAYNTETNVLGVVADPSSYNAYGVIDGYVLGAKEIWGVQTDVRLNWVWSNDHVQIEAAVDDLIDQGADVIMCYTETDYTAEYAASRGVKVVANSCDLPELAPDSYLTGFFLNASTFLVDTIRSICAEVFSSSVHEGGIAAGTARLVELSDSCKEGTEEITTKLYDYLKNGQAYPFTGEIKNRSNEVMVDKGQRMSFSGIRAINWLVQGVTAVGDFTTVTYELTPNELVIKK